MEPFGVCEESTVETDGFSQSQIQLLIDLLIDYQEKNDDLNMTEWALAQSSMDILEGWLVDDD